MKKLANSDFVVNSTRISLQKKQSYFETITMGNELSSTPILPLSFGDCFVNSRLDIKKYQLYLLVKSRITLYDIHNLSTDKEIKWGKIYLKIFSDTHNS